MVSLKGLTTEHPGEYPQLQLPAILFTLERVDYVVPVPGAARRPLHYAYECVKPGTCA